MIDYAEEQKAIIQQVEGRMIVVACPGSGKTTTMLERVHYMVQEKKIHPGEILVVTFTKAAAEEMRSRFDKKHPEDGKVCFATIHSICFSILRNEYNLSINNILKEWEQMKHFKTFLKDSMSNNCLEEGAKTLIQMISGARNAGLDPYKVYGDIELSGKKYTFAPLYKSYEMLKRDTNKIDFDDMLILCLELLNKDVRILEKYQNIYKYIIIDEYQDTNKIQAKIFYRLAEKSGNLCIVGDDDQSIYGFRAADSSIMLSFKKKFPDARFFNLSTNYRSGYKIINYAGKLIGNNKVRFGKKFLAGVKESGEIFLGEYDSPITETEHIIEWIRNKHKMGTEYRDMAILYRTNAEVIYLMPRFKKLEIPVSIREKPGDIHKNFVFEAIHSYFKLSQLYDLDVECLPEGIPEYMQKVLNCPNRYLKAEFFKNCTLSKESIKGCLDEYFTKNKYNEKRCHDIQDAIESIKDTLEILKGKNTKRFLRCLINSDFQKWIEHASEFRGISTESSRACLKDIISEGESFGTMEEWMEYVGDFEDYLEECGTNPDGVRLSTFHGAKGLEWENVWIMNVSKGNVPYYKIFEGDVESGMEEERRMFYVAFTRAKSELQLSYTKAPGAFLGEILGCQSRTHPPIMNKQVSFTDLGY